MAWFWPANSFTRPARIDHYHKTPYHCCLFLIIFMQVDTYTCRDLINQGQLEQALKHLSNSALPGEERNILVLLNGQWEESERDFNQNLIPYEQHSRDRSRIMASLLDLLDQMEGEFLQNSAVNRQLEFFEAGGVLPDKGGRHYKAEFADAETRYIYWELRLMHTAVIGKIEFDLRYELFRPDGSLLANIQKRRSIEPGWINSFFTDGWGAENPGSYQPGTYTVKEYVNGKAVAEGRFTIV